MGTDAQLAGQAVGPYTVEKLVGEGGFAVVYRAVHRELSREVVLKMHKPAAGSAREALARFQRESKLLAKLAHPGIIGVYDHGEHEDTPWFAMPFLTEPTLQVLLERQQGNPYTPGRAVKLVASMLDALEAAHAASVVHRDVKPSNVFVRTDHTVILTDFGIAKTLDGSTQITGAGQSLGTLLYAAPEQLSNAEIGVGADLYSAGLILYHLLAGRLPFGTRPAEVLTAKQGELPTPTSLGAAVPAPLEQLVMRAVHRDADARFADATAFRNALIAALPNISGVNRRLPRPSGKTPLPGADRDAPVLQPGSRPGSSGSSGSRPTLTPGRRLVPGFVWAAFTATLAAVAGLAFLGGLVVGRERPLPPPAPALPSAHEAHETLAPIDTVTIPREYREVIGSLIRMYPGYAPTADERELFAILAVNDHAKVDAPLRVLMRKCLPRFGEGAVYERQLTELMTEHFMHPDSLPMLLNLGVGKPMPAPDPRTDGRMDILSGFIKMDPYELTSWLLLTSSPVLEQLRRARHQEPASMANPISPRSLIFYLSVMRDHFYLEVGGWARVLLASHKPDEAKRGWEHVDPIEWTDSYRLFEMDRRIGAFFRAHPDPR